ncbi:MAG: amino acid permease, partial [Gammaproteobacteria bacterium]
ALALNNLFAVAGIFVSRLRHIEIERPYKTALYPITPLLYCALTLWTLSYLAIERPTEILASLAIIIAGVVFYFFSRNKP